VIFVGDNGRFLHCGGKCAAFGRNDSFWGPGKKTDNGKDNSRFLHCGGKCAAFGRNDSFWGLGGEDKQLQRFNEEVILER
jgi:hypothetical protein